MLERVGLQGGGTKAEELWRKPLVAQHLLKDTEILERLLRRTYSTGGLDPSLETKLIVVLLDDRGHDVDRLGRGAGVALAGRGLDEVCVAEESKNGCLNDILGRLEGTGLKDHLQDHILSSLSLLLQQVTDGLVVTGEESAHRKDDIDLLCPIVNCQGDLRYFDLGEGL